METSHYAESPIDLPETSTTPAFDGLGTANPGDSLGELVPADELPTGWT
ncbi:MAG: hypothetical protein JJU20_12145 [Opitutales bacterium]|nr:hypothetical protein [Opitutales bacterium]